MTLSARWGWLNTASAKAYSQIRPFNRTMHSNGVKIGPQKSSRIQDVSAKVLLAPFAAPPFRTRTSAPTRARPCATPAPSDAYGRKPWPARRSSSASFAAIAPLNRRPLRSCARCWCRDGGPSVQTTGDPAIGWALGTLFPEFDEVARPIKRRINHAAVATLPISFRPALLAGLSRAIAHPAVLDAIREETILQGRRAFERLCEEARIDAHATGKSHPT